MTDQGGPGRPSNAPSRAAEAHTGPVSQQVAGLLLLGVSRASRPAIASDLRDLFAFADLLGIAPLALTRPHLDLYLRHLLEVRGLAPATAVRRLATIRALMSYAVEEGIIGDNP